MNVKYAAKKNFSRYAHLYDEHAGIQRVAAETLIKEAPARPLKAILDIGCGTGNYTLLLRGRFADSGIRAIDISTEMVEAAALKLRDKGVEFTVADAETFDPQERFDLVTSNAAFQWFRDPEGALARYSAALAPGGVMLFSTFGPLTFHELGWSIKYATGGNARIDSESFPSADALSDMMKRRFSRSGLGEVTVKVEYGSLAGLLAHIKYTGTRGSGAGNTLLWKREMLGRTEDVYRAKFGRIEASYQIFICRAER